MKKTLKIYGDNYSQCATNRPVPENDYYNIILKLYSLLLKYLNKIREI